jgi:hypothetical protein
MDFTGPPDRRLHVAASVLEAAFRLRLSPVFRFCFEFFIFSVVIELEEIKSMNWKKVESVAGVN